MGARDGWFCKMETPLANEATHSQAFHNGHYNAQGVNVQVCCDSECSGTHFSINSPASTNDVVAYAESSLSSIVDNLPNGKFLVCENAYINTNKLLTPYLGQKRQDVAKDTFSFDLSQCKIRIMQAFGQLTNVWRVIDLSLRLHQGNVPRLIQAAMRLHNFLLNERQC
jgi:DDE superfamily endonuclease